MQRTISYGLTFPRISRGAPVLVEGHSSICFPPPTSLLEFFNKTDFRLQNRRSRREHSGYVSLTVSRSTNKLAAKASEYFTPLLVDIANGLPLARCDMPAETRKIQSSPFAHRRLKSRVRRRLCLPLVFEGRKGPTTVLACPDSGSDWNVMALETAKPLDTP
jgi:hypothetical protein